MRGSIAEPRGDVTTVWLGLLRTFFGRAKTADDASGRHILKV